MIGMPWRGTHAAELSICQDLEPQSTMRDARSGATLLDWYLRLEPTRREINALLGFCSGLNGGAGKRHRRAATMDRLGSRLGTTTAAGPYPYGWDPPLQPTATAYGKFS